MPMQRRPSNQGHTETGSCLPHLGTWWIFPRKEASEGFTWWLSGSGEASAQSDLGDSEPVAGDEGLLCR